MTNDSAVSPRQVRRILTNLHETHAADPDANSNADAATLYIPPSSGADVPPPAPWADALQRVWGRGRPGAHNGVAAFRVGQTGVAFLPPFPLQPQPPDVAAATVAAPVLHDGIHDGPLLNLLDGQYTVGVALVRLGRYAIAVYQGQQLAVSKTDTRYVKSKHHAGGTSQQRFRRVRENQIHRLYVEAAGVLERQWRPWLNRLDYVALGGEAATVNGFVKECDLLARLAPITLPRRLNVRQPNRAALDRLGPLLYQSQAHPLQWDA